MKMPDIKSVEVKHSKSKDAWNVVGTMPGGKYKIARIPYYVCESSEIITTKNKAEALQIAQFISYCFNHQNRIF